MLIKKYAFGQYDTHYFDRKDLCFAIRKVLGLVFQPPRVEFSDVKSCVQINEIVSP